MSQTVTAHFDGSVFVPDEPVRLAAGQAVRLHVEPSDRRTAQFAELLPFSPSQPERELGSVSAGSGGDAATVSPQQAFKFGLHAGRVSISDDFDASLPDAFWLGEAQS